MNSTRCVDEFSSIRPKAGGKDLPHQRGMGLPKIIGFAGPSPQFHFQTMDLKFLRVLDGAGNGERQIRKEAETCIFGEPAMMSRRTHEGLKPPFPHPQRKSAHQPKPMSAWMKQGRNDLLRGNDEPFTGCTPALPAILSSNEVTSHVVLWVMR